MLQGQRVSRPTLADAPGASGSQSATAHSDAPASEKYLHAVRAIVRAAADGGLAPDPATVAQAACTVVADLTGLRGCAVYAADIASSLVRCIGHCGLTPAFLGRFGTLPSDSNAAMVEVLRGGARHSGNTNGAGISHKPPHEMLRLAGANTYIAVPFHHGTDSGGSVIALGRRDGPPGEDEVALLQIVAEQVGQALSVAEARGQLAVAREQTRFLTDANRALGTTVDLDEVLQLTAQRAVETLGAWYVVYLRDREREVLEPRVVRHSDPRRTALLRQMFEAQAVGIEDDFIGPLLQRGQPHLFREADAPLIRHLTRADEPWQQEELVRVQSWAFLPLTSRAECIGALVVARLDRPMEDQDLELACTFAESAARAIANAHLFEAEHAQRAYAEAARARLQEVDWQKDAFLSMASHELRTPLTSAKGFAQVLLRRAQRRPHPSAQEIEGLSTIDTQLGKMAALIKDVLDLSRLQSGTLPLHLSSVDLGVLARSVVGRLRMSLDTDRIAVDVPAEPLLGIWDRDRIEQILENLLENAVKYSPAGGPIDVTVSHEVHWAVLRVRDHGLGIPSSAVPQLFQRFYRVRGGLHEQIAGIGIGLYISREIAERHAGSIQVELPEGPGTAFVVRLPLLPAAPD